MTSRQTQLLKNTRNRFTLSSPTTSPRKSVHSLSTRSSLFGDIYWFIRSYCNQTWLRQHASSISHLRYSWHAISQYLSRSMNIQETFKSFGMRSQFWSLSIAWQATPTSTTVTREDSIRVESAWSRTKMMSWLVSQMSNVLGTILRKSGWTNSW